MYRFYDYASLLKWDEILVYLRKSRSDDPMLSVEEVLQKHETILDEWAEKNLGSVIPEENKYREIVSGETIADRPEIQKVLRMIESPKIKAILVVEVQRLSRGDLEDAGRLIKLFRYTDTLVITPAKTYDLQDEYDRDIFERELKRGNEFLEYQKKIMNRGRLLSVSQGNFIGSVPPYGYDKIWVMEGKRKCPTLQENKEQADVVRMIFDMYVNKDMGKHRICNHLDNLGIKPPKGDFWSPPAVKDMLGNVHYIGKVKWNWRKTVTIVEDSEIIKTRPKAKAGEFLIYDGKHEGIIPEKLFEAAQEKQGRNHRAKPSTKIRNPFASILFCHCGRAMSLRTYKQKDGRERSAPRLLCDNQTHCNTGSCLYEEMIDRVCIVLEESIADFELQLKDNSADSVKIHNRLIKNLEAKLRDLQAKELAQWEAQSNPDPAQRMPSIIFKQLNEKLVKEKEETEQAIRMAYEAMPDPIYLEDKIARFTDALSALRNPDIDAQKKNQLLKSCVDKIIYTREKPHRLMRKPDEKKGERLPVGSAWSTPPFELEVRLKV